MESFKTIGNQSLPATPSCGFFSPSPLRKPAVAKVNSNVARELFSFSDETSVDPFGRNLESPSTFLKAKFATLKTESDSSSKMSEWSSDSGCVNYSDLDLESPKKPFLKNPFNQDQIFEEIAHGVPSRAENPIVNDEGFRTCERIFFPSASRTALVSGSGTEIPELY